MTADEHTALVVHGWTVFAHPLFTAQVEALAVQVEALKQKDQTGYIKKNATKRLAAIDKLAFDVIPQDPTRAEYRQGGTLGGDRKHWCRAKFFQQYRLFFRYHAAAKVIVYAWMSDDDTKRVYESNDDAYHVFRQMLERGSPTRRLERVAGTGAACGAAAGADGDQPGVVATGIELPIRVRSARFHAGAWERVEITLHRPPFGRNGAMATPAYALAPASLQRLSH